MAWLNLILCVRPSLGQGPNSGELTPRLQLAQPLNHSVSAGITMYVGDIVKVVLFLVIVVIVCGCLWIPAFVCCLKDRLETARQQARARNQTRLIRPRDRPSLKTTTHEHDQQAQHEASDKPQGWISRIFSRRLLFAKKARAKILG